MNNNEIKNNLNLIIEDELRSPNIDVIVNSNGQFLTYGIPSDLPPILYTDNVSDNHISNKNIDMLCKLVAKLDRAGTVYIINVLL